MGISAIVFCLITVSFNTGNGLEQGLAAVKGRILNKSDQTLVVDFEVGFKENKTFIPPASYRLTVVKEDFCALERELLKGTL